MDIDELAAIQEVQHVMSRYELYYDTGRLDPLVALFAEDCRINYPGTTLTSRSEVRDHLSAYFEGATGVEESFHMLANPWVEMYGDEAIGRWHFFGAYTLTEIGAAWLAGFYEIEFRKVDGDWKIDTLDFDKKWTTPYEDGWAKTPNVDR